MAEGLHSAFRVADVIPEGQVGVTLLLDGTLAAAPGQFVMGWLPGVEERPFSIMDDEPLSLSVAVVGPFSQALAGMRAGQRLWIRGPFGRSFPGRGARQLLLGGGCGAAGLTLLAKRSRAAGAEVTVALGARSADKMMLAWRFRELGCRVIYATDDGSLGVRGTAIDAAAGELGSGWPGAVYGCGPEPMLRALARRCGQLGLPCWLSVEANMKCGIGVCGSCHCGDRLVCQDGPVFSAREMIEIWAHGILPKHDAD